MLTVLLAFAAAAALVVLLPGPDSLLVLRAAVARGPRHALSTGAGVVAGLVLWVSAAVLGLSAVLRASETAYTALKLAGAAYLIWLGVQALLRSRRGESPPARARGGTGFTAGLITNVLNPKIGVFFITFLPGFVPAGSPVAATSLLLGGIYIVETVVYFAVLVALVGRAARWLARPGVRRGLDRAAAVVFLGFGVRLATQP